MVKTKCLSKTEVRDRNSVIVAMVCRTGLILLSLLNYKFKVSTPTSEDTLQLCRSGEMSPWKNVDSEERNKNFGLGM